MRYFLRKSAFYIFTAWAAITINFFLPRMLKGDPVTAYIQQHQGEISPDANRYVCCLDWMSIRRCSSNIATTG